MPHRLLAALVLALSLQLSPASPTALAADPPAVEGLEGQSRSWQAVLEQVVPAVVSIRVTAVRDFDTEGAGISQGTGFIVDAERGLVLTNRHMVHAGPVLAEAVLLNNEEIELQPIYRDPVHDFGFYRFDPADVRHMEITELKLDPNGARVGREIRVVGNDAGEKISILDGTLARLDRNAPSYGGNTYNDFNTFYIQAASNTSGGSSGSPVVDERGRVVALNAGGRKGAASSFYLPLDRVVRALELIQAGEPVERGTLQTVFSHTVFDELRRLGIRPETESLARRTGRHRTGMLVVREIVPEGPADGKLKVGDVLVRVDGQPVTEFADLEARLDEAVGRTLSVEVERGGQPLEIALEVQDLHAITPADYLEVGRAVLHDLSYQQARNHHRPVRGAYLAVPGYMFSTARIPSGAVITHVDGTEVANLDELQAELERKADGQRVVFRFNAASDPRQGYESVAVMDRTWYPMQRCRRADDGFWPCVDSPPPPTAPPESKVTALLSTPAENRVEERIASSLVWVDFNVPHPTAGVKDFNFVGAGVVVDAAQGLVLVDRDTVPVTLGDMMLTFAGSVRVPGRVRYLHPVHNIAIVQYDPAVLGDLEVRAIEWSSRLPDEDDTIWMVGLGATHEVVSKKTSVSKVEPLVLGHSGTPRFRDTNVDVFSVEESEGSLGGVLADRRGRVHALWASFLDQRRGSRVFRGLPHTFIEPVLEDLRRGREPNYRTLGAELVPLSLATARDRGLSDARVEQLLRHDPDRRHVLEVRRIHAKSGAADALRQTDLLLEIEGRPVTRMSDIEALHDREEVEVTLLRDGKEQTVRFATLPLQGTGVDRVVSWAGLILHEPHYEVAAQRGIEANGIYVAWLWYGSPAHRYGIHATRRIVAVDDTPTPDIDAFLAAVASRGDREALRLTMEALDGSVLVNTLKLDLRYWPTQVYELRNGEWHRTEEPVNQRRAEARGIDGG